MTIDDPVVLDRQVAYLDAVRALGRRERSWGLIASLIGVLIIVVARFRLSGEPWALWGGAAIVAVADVGVYWYGGAVGYEVIAFVAILVLCGFSMFRVWRDQHTYS